MCECSWVSCAPTVALTITVRHCFNHQRFAGFVTADGLIDGGAIMPLSNGRHEFGPFDSSTEVGYWIQRQAGAIKALVHPDMFRKLAE